MAGMDTSELDALAADLGRSAAELPKKVRASLSKGLLNIKTQMRAEAAMSTHFGIASAVNYDITGSGLDLEGEVGYDKGGPGDLANLAIWGASRGGGGTVADPEDALLAEVPRFEKALGDLGLDVL